MKGAGFPARARLGILSALVPAAALAGGVTPEEYRAAFDGAFSDVPAYVQVTITPEPGGDEWTGCVGVPFLIGAVAIQADLPIETQNFSKLVELARQSNHFHFGPAAMAKLPIYSESDRAAGRAWAAWATNEQWLEIGRRGPVDFRPVGKDIQIPYSAMACAFIERGITAETASGQGSNQFRIGWHREP